MSKFNRLISLDTQREVALAIISVGNASEDVAGPSPKIDPLELTAPVSDYEIDCPAIREIHGASSLKDQREVAAWREGGMPTVRTASALGTPIPLEPLSDDEMPKDPIEKVITRRGSARQFSREPMTFHELSTILLK